MNVPKLRFKEFNDEWITYKFYDLVSIINGQVDPNKKGYCNLPHIGPGNIEKETGRLLEYNLAKDDKLISSKYLFNEKSVIYGKINPHFAKVCYPKFVGLCSADAYPINPIEEKLTSTFLLYLLLNPKFTKFATSVSMRTGMPKINRDELGIYKFTIPKINEQIKIGKTLSLLDKKIELQTKKIEDLKLFKLYIRNKIFSGIKTKDKIINTLNYEQPNRYIVKSDDYLNDENLIPVLTANKAFILGYCNEDDYYNKGDVIIFDDFTMDSKYVNFNFKIKSSAIKLLTQKNNNNLKYIFECLQALNLESTEHKRHYISIVQEIEIPVPDITVQNRIADLMFMYDKKIKLESDNYNKLIELKKGLMQNLFV